MTLQEAVLTNDLAKVHVLLREGADINGVDKDKNTPLHLAAQVGNPDMVNLLLSQKASVKALNAKKQTPLHIAAQHARKRMIEALISAGADVHAIDQNKRTALHYATLGNHDLTVDLFLTKQANPLAADQTGATAMHLAATYGYKKVIRALLRKTRGSVKALLEAQDDEGKTPLHCAAFNSNPEVLLYLLDKKVNVNAQTDYGYTPLFYAIRSEHEAVAKTLVATGAHLFIDNVNGQNPIEFAKQLTQQPALLTFLLDHREALIKASETPSMVKLVLQGDKALEAHQFQDAQTAYLTLLQEATAKADIPQQIQAWQKLSKVAVRKQDYALAAKFLMGTEYCHYALQAKVFPSSDNVLGTKQLSHQRQYILEQFLLHQLPEAQATKGLAQLQEHSISHRRFLAEGRQALRAALGDEKADIPLLLKKNTERLKDVIGRFTEDAIKVLGQPPCGYALAALGSLSRQEASAYSDAEFAILLDTDSETHRQYFRRFTRYLELQFIFLGETEIKAALPVASPIRDGFCLDMGGGGLNPLGLEGVFELIGTPLQLAQFQQLRYFEGAELIINNALKNVDVIAGDARLVEEYTKQKDKVLEQKVVKNKKSISLRRIQALGMLREELNWYEPKLNQQKEKERQFNVKDELYRLPNCIINNLAVYYQLSSKNTWERLEELRRKGYLTKSACEHLKQAMASIARLRLSTHLHYHCEKEAIHHRDSISANEPSSVFELCERDIQTLFSIYRVILPLHRAIKRFVESKGQDKTFTKVDFYDDAFIAQGEAYERACRYEEARQAYQKAKSTYPDSLPILLALANIQGILGDVTSQQALLEDGLAKLRQATERQDKLYLARVYIGLGDVQATLGNAKQQLHYLEQARGIYTALYGDGHEETANVLARIAMAHGALGQLDKQKELLQKALAIHEKTSSIERSSAAAGILVNLGITEYQLGQYNASKSLLERALAMDEAHYGPEHPAVASTLLNLANTVGALGDMNQKRLLLERALMIQEKVYGIQHTELVATLNNLGNVYLQLGHAPRCIELLERAVTLQEKQTLAPVKLAITLVNLADAYASAGNSAKQKECLARALDLLTKLDKEAAQSSLVADVLLNLGETYLQLGEFSAAENSLKQALALYESHRTTDKLAAVLKQLARLYEKQGQTEQQINYLERLLNLHEKATPLVLAESLYTLGTAYSAASQFEKARAVLTRALTLYEKATSAESTATTTLAPLLKALAHVCQALGDNKAAGSYLKRADSLKPLPKPVPPQPVPPPVIYPDVGYWQQRKKITEDKLALTEKLYGGESIPVAKLLIALAEIYEAVGDSQQQYAALVRALPLVEQACQTEQDVPDVLTLYIRLSEASDSLGEQTEQVRYAEKAMVWASKTSEHPQSALAFVCQGEVYKQQGNLPEAKALHEKSLVRQEKLATASPLTLLHILTALGDTYGCLHEHALSKQTLTRALTLYQTHYGTQAHPLLASLYATCCRQSLAEGDTRLAKDYGEKALNLQQQLLATDDIRLAKTHTLLAQVYQALGDKTPARQALEKAHTLYQMKLGATHPLTQAVQTCLSTGNASEVPVLPTNKSGAASGKAPAATANAQAPVSTQPVEKKDERAKFNASKLKEKTVKDKKEQSVESKPNKLKVLDAKTRRENEAHTQEMKEDFEDTNRTLLAYASTRAYTPGIKEGIESFEKIAGDLKRDEHKLCPSSNCV